MSRIKPAAESVEDTLPFPDQTIINVRVLSAFSFNHFSIRGCLCFQCKDQCMISPHRTICFVSVYKCVSDWWSVEGRVSYKE